MPRIPRGQQAGNVYHTINRGNGRATVFHKNQDYEAFLSLLGDAKGRHPVKIFAFCLMPNHFHFVLEPSHEKSSESVHAVAIDEPREALSQAHYGGSGHIWQRRFKSFPVQRNEHLITVIRYVLQNPVRASLCASAKEWNWSSLRRTELVDAWLVKDQDGWLNELEQPLPARQLDSVRECVNRQRPFGKTDWQREIARVFGLKSTLRARGRPQNEKKSSLSEPVPFLIPGFFSALLPESRPHRPCSPRTVCQSGRRASVCP